MQRSDVVAAVAIGAVALVVLALGDNDAVASAIGVAICMAIVLAILSSERRLAASGTLDRIRRSGWLYLTVPIWALIGAAGVSFLPRVLDLPDWIRISTAVIGGLIGALVRIDELRERRRAPEQAAPPPPRTSLGSGAR